MNPGTPVWDVVIPRDSHLHQALLAQQPLIITAKWLYVIQIIIQKYRSCLTRCTVKNKSILQIEQTSVCFRYVLLTSNAVNRSKLSKKWRSNIQSKFNILRPCKKFFWSCLICWYSEVIRKLSFCYLCILSCSVC